MHKRVVKHVGRKVSRTRLSIMKVCVRQDTLSLKLTIVKRGTYGERISYYARPASCDY